MYGTLDDSPHDTKQKAATALLRDELLMHDFARPVFLRASRILGPISRFRFAQIPLRMKRASRASCPGLHVGFFALCNGVCTAQRFHTEGGEKCAELDARTNPHVSYYNECRLLYNLFAST